MAGDAGWTPERAAAGSLFEAAWCEGQDQKGGPLMKSPDGFGSAGKLDAALSRVSVVENVLQDFANGGGFAEPRESFGMECAVAVGRDGASLLGVDVEGGSVPTLMDDAGLADGYERLAFPVNGLAATEEAVRMLAKVHKAPESAVRLASGLGGASARDRVDAYREATRRAGSSPKRELAGAKALALSAAVREKLADPEFRRDLRAVARRVEKSRPSPSSPGPC